VSTEVSLKDGERLLVLATNNLSSILNLMQNVSQQSTHQEEDLVQSTLPQSNLTIATKWVILLETAKNQLNLLKSDDNPIVSPKERILAH